MVLALLGRKVKRKVTRVFFATDVHGSTDCFQKFVNAATVYSCTCLVLGGDITGKTVVPIVRTASGRYEATFVGSDYELASETEVAQFEQVISRSGVYAFRITDEEFRSFGESGNRAAKVEEISHDLMTSRLREWLDFAEERLLDSDVRIYMGAGNDDPFELDKVLESSPRVIWYDGRIVQLDENHEMLGLGYANVTPWNCPRDVEEDELRRRLEDLVAKLKDVSQSVFCVHVPPIDSLLDTCYKLDSSCYPPAMVLDRLGVPVEFGAGSVAVREAIEKYQPLVGLHGHIHESRGRVLIGRTEAFNPGSEYSEGLLRGLILNLFDDGVQSYQFTSG